MLTGASWERKWIAGRSPSRSVPLPGQQAVSDVDGVLPVRQQQALLEHEAVHLVPPDRQPALQAELGDGSVCSGVMPESSSAPV